MKTLMSGYQWVFMTAVMMSATTAIAGTNIGAPSSGFFAKVGAWLQALVDFIEGPWGIFVSIAGLALAVTVWMFSTRGGEQLGTIAKVIIAVLLIINIPALVVALRAF